MDANGPMSRENTIGFPVFLFFRSYVKLQPGQRSGVIVSSCLFAHAFQYFWLLSSSCFSHYSFLSDIWNNPTKFNEKREPEIPWFPSKMGKKRPPFFWGSIHWISRTPRGNHRIQKYAVRHWDWSVLVLVRMVRFRESYHESQIEVMQKMFADGEETAKCVWLIIIVICLMLCFDHDNFIQFQPQNDLMRRSVPRGFTHTPFSPVPFKVLQDRRGLTVAGE